VAVLVNRAALAASLGDKASPDAIDKQVKEIEQLVTSAAGLRKDRGDAVKISVVDFVDSGKDLEPVPAPSFLEIVERQTGTLISAGVILLIAVLLILFGIRPVTRALLAPPPAALEALESQPEMGMAIAPALDPPAALTDGTLLIRSSDERDQFLEELLERRDKNPQRHLQKLVDFDEEHAAAILKQWIRQGAIG
jgi:flagellar M-ring protein FliF